MGREEGGGGRKAEKMKREGEKGREVEEDEGARGQERRTKLHVLAMLRPNEFTLKVPRGERG